MHEKLYGNDRNAKSVVAKANHGTDARDATATRIVDGVGKLTIEQEALYREAEREVGEEAMRVATFAAPVICHKRLLERDFEYVKRLYDDLRPKTEEEDIEAGKRIRAGSFKRGDPFSYYYTDPSGNRFFLTEFADGEVRKIPNEGGIFEPRQWPMPCAETQALKLGVQLRPPRKPGEERDLTCFTKTEIYREMVARDQAKVR